MTKFVSEKIRKKSSARLAAVQATYMAFFGEMSVDEAIQDFKEGKIGRYVIDETGSPQTEELVEFHRWIRPILKIWSEVYIGAKRQLKNQSGTI